MSDRQTSCVHRGNTFFGIVEVIGDGPDRVIRVRYNSEERETALDGLTVDIVAHLLLKDLVLLEFEAIGSSTAGRADHADGDRRGGKMGWAA